MKEFRRWSGTLVLASLACIGWKFGWDNGTHVERVALGALLLLVLAMFASALDAWLRPTLFVHGFAYAVASILAWLSVLLVVFGMPFIRAPVVAGFAAALIGALFVVRWRVRARSQQRDAAPE